MLIGVTIALLLLAPLEKIRGILLVLLVFVMLCTIISWAFDSGAQAAIWRFSGLLDFNKRKKLILGEIKTLCFRAAETPLLAERLYDRLRDEFAEQDCPRFKDVEADRTRVAKLVALGIFIVFLGLLFTFAKSA
ncbi:MAG: hypothetical protein ABI439_09065 [Rhodospirillales bacterium]